MISASPVSEVQQLVSAGRFAEAATQLMRAADLDDAEALFTLATWRISGQIVRRDTTAARELMGRAAEAGHREARLLHAHFLANGTGGPADWKTARHILETMRDGHPAAAEQLAMLEKMPVGDDGEPTSKARLETLSETPAVYRCSNFLADHECAYLVSKGEPRLQPSTVTDRATGRSLPHPVRRSDGTFFGVANEDLVVNAINRRIAAASGTSPEQAEPLQLLRYGPGGEFRPHHDAVKEGGNQRIITALVYLSDDYEGGETRFMKTGLKFRGRAGDLLLFRNVTPDGRPDPLAEHAGLPVTRGVKLVASRWIWREPPTFPPPNPILPDK